MKNFNQYTHFILGLLLMVMGSVVDAGTMVDNQHMQKPSDQPVLKKPIKKQLKKIKSQERTIGRVKKRRSIRKKG